MEIGYLYSHYQAIYCAMWSLAKVAHSYTFRQSDTHKFYGFVSRVL